MPEARVAGLVRRVPGDASRLPDSLAAVVRRVYANRGIVDATGLDLALSRLLPPEFLNIEAAAALLADALQAQRRIVIAGDYDADGATGTALGVLGLRALGARRVCYAVPNRFTMGYGLTPKLVAGIARRGADLIVTVDNGIASVAGVAAARAAGIDVIVTDHHLAPETRPDANLIVDPNQPGCRFPSKCVAGVGVMFYVLLALRAELRRRHCFSVETQPNLAEFLDLVALGTVADVVRLDHNNRVLVAQGLARIRTGRCRPGILALLEAARRDYARASAQDLGFVVGPRLNAAGRLEDMHVGIECLLAPDMATARPLAAQLDAINRERRDIEQQMRDEALAALPDVPAGCGLCVYHPGWHEGVVGLVASRVRERTHRPVLAFAPASTAGELKGSGRSIPGLHIRDVLAAVDAAAPGVILRFGGHAMAAGLSLREADYERFSALFDAACRHALQGLELEERLETDGELAPQELTLETARALEEAGPFGQGFPEPVFDGGFEVLDANPVGADGRHVRYRLRSGGMVVNAIHFDGAELARADGAVHIAYALSVNRFRDSETAQLLVKYLGVGA